jgi:hypothetical protein
MPNTRGVLFDSVAVNGGRGAANGAICCAPAGEARPASAIIRTAAALAMGRWKENMRRVLNRISWMGFS